MCYASMLTYITQTLHMFWFFTYITYCMPTWLTHTSIAFYMCYASMLTYITQTLHMFRFFTMYADLAHPYIYHFLNIYMYLCWLGSPRPLHVFRFFTFISRYPLYADLAHPYIYHFLNIHVSMLTYITQTPSCVQICYLHHTLYADLAYPYILAS